MRAGKSFTTTRLRLKAASASVWAFKEAYDLFTVLGVTGAPWTSALRINLYIEQTDRAKGTVGTNHATAKTVPDGVGLDAIYGVHVTARIGRGVGLDPAA